MADALDLPPGFEPDPPPAAAPPLDASADMPPGFEADPAPASAPPTLALAPEPEPLPDPATFEAEGQTFNIPEPSLYRPTPGRDTIGPASYSALESSGLKSIAPDEERLRLILDAGLTRAPDQHAGVLAISRQTGVPADIVETRYPEFKAKAEAAKLDPARFRQENPELARLLLDHPQLAPIVPQDGPLMALGRVLAARVRTGMRGTELLDVGTRAMQEQADHGAVSAETEQRLLDAERAVGTLPEAKGAIETVAFAAADLIPSLGETLTAGVQGALVGGVAGAAVGAAGGALAGGVGAIPGAIAGALPGAVTGSRAASALRSYQLESAGAFLEIRKMKTDDGRPVDPEIARGAAIVYGVAASAVETLALGPVVRMLGPLGDAITKGEGKAALRALMQTKSFRVLAADVVKRWGKGALSEAGEEGVQNVLQDIAGWAARSRTAGDLESADPAASLAEGAQVAWTTALGTAALGVPASTFNVVTQRLHVARSEQAGEQVAALVGLKDSPTVRAAPDLVAELVAKETAKSGEAVTHLYVDPQAFTRLFQDEKTDPALAIQELMGEEGAAKLQEALATGEKLEIPVAEYLEKWGPKDIAERLAEDTTTRPGLATVKELAAVTPEALEAEAQKIAGETAAAVEKAKKPPSEAEIALVDTVKEQLVATGVYGKRDAGKAVALTREFLATQAKAFDLAPDVLFADYAMRVERGTGVEAAPAMAAQEVLEQAARTQTQAPEFKAWFGGSKVVDEKGEPLVVYHGTARSFDRFDERKAGSASGTKAERAFFFSTEPDEASGRADVAAANERPGEAAAVLPVFLRLENPFVSHLDRYNSKAFAAEIRKAKAAGHDGITFPDLTYASEKGTVAVFESTQIKSATGNRGTFDPADPNILHQTGAASPRGYLDRQREGAKRAFRVVLNPNADLSTFLHETGHVFLEMFGDLAERPDAPERVRKDWADTLEYLGIASRGEVKREQHEKWARSFEAYLLEGKAPSAKLVAAFTRFSLWLKGIYRSAAALDVPLSDEIKGVFDRLLATDESIEKTKRAMGLAPIFRSPVEAGIAPEAHAAYLEDQMSAVAQAQRTLERRVLEDRKRETESWWKAEEKKLRGEALVEWKIRPDVLAAEFLGKNKGVAPDDAAELFGFATGAEMLGAVAAVAGQDGEVWAKEQAAARMREQHPGVADDMKELDALAAKALHGRATSDWLLSELAILRRKAGTKNATRTDAIRRAADILVERRAVRKLDAGRAQQAERSASDKATAAAAKGKWEEAVVYKEQQALNHFMHRALFEARERRDELLEFATKARKTDARAKLGLASPVYRDGIDGILEAVALKDPESREAPLAGIPEVVALMTEHGTSVVFDEAGLAGIIAKPRDYRDLSVAEMRNVLAAVKNIKKSARNFATVLIDGKRRDKAELVAELVAEAETSLPALSPRPSSKAAMSFAERGASLGSSLAGYLLKPELMMEWLGPKWGRAIVLPLQAAKHAEADLMKKTIRPIIDAMQAMPLEVRRRLGEKVDGAALFPTHRTDGRPPSRRFELLSVALNWGNAGNRQRLLDGRGITQQQVETALSTLSRHELEWVQTVWDAMESLAPLSFALEERDSGLAPPKVEATPFTVRLADGTDVTMRGGYYTIVYDRDLSNMGEKQAASAIAGLMDPSFTRPGTAHGHLKGRATEVKEPIALDLSVIGSHLMQAAHDIAYREAVKSVGGLILHPAIQAAMKQRLGVERAQTLLQWVKDVGQMRAAGIDAHAGPIAAVFRGFRSNAAFAILGYAADVAMGDLSNLLVSATVLETKHWAAGMADFARSPKKMRAFALEKSGELRFRHDDMQRTFQSEMRKLTASASLPRRTLDWYRDHAFDIMEWTDAGTATPAWLGAYRQALAKGEADARAVEFADATIRKLSPSSSAVDRSAFLRDKGFIGTAALFQGYVGGVIVNLMAAELHPIHTAKGAAMTAKASARAAAKITGLLIAYSVVGELLTGRGPEESDGDDEIERWTNWFLRKMFMGAVSPAVGWFPGASGFIESVAMGKKPSVRSAPAFAVAEQLARAVQTATRDGVDPLRAATEVLKVGGLLKGIPTRPLRSVEYVSRLAAGESETRGPFDVVSGVVHGEREEQPANVFTLMQDLAE